MRQTKFILLFVMIAFLMSCDDDKKESPIEKHLTLSKDEINVTSEGLTDTLLVDSKSEWFIVNEDTQHWYTIEKKGSDSLLVSVDEYHMFKDRKATVAINNEDETVQLSIIQKAVNKESNNGVEEAVIGENQNIFRTQELFITPEMREHIFHGNILNKTLIRNKGLEYKSNYTYNPITFGTDKGSIKENFWKKNVIPSFKLSNDLANDVIASQPTQYDSYVSQSPIQINSYKELQIIDLKYYGLKLDEIITGKPYTEKEMDSSVIGLFYSYRQSIFCTAMDYPGPLIKESIDDELADSLVYVNSIIYGKTAILFVESTYDYQLSKNVINKIADNEALDDEEKKVAESLNATYISFKKNGEISVDKSIDAINSYNNGINKLPVLPIRFTINDLKDNGVADIAVVY